MPVDRTRLLSDCQAEAKRLIDSLRERLGDEPRLADQLQAEYQAAREAQRTGDSQAEWTEERLNQVAASWVLGCVFVRFLEDNQLVEVPHLAGPGERLTRARDEETLYFRKHPQHGPREYLEHVFRETARLPAMRWLLGEKNPLWTLGPTGDGARALLELWRKRDPDTGALVHDFTDPERDTRFLGDLYQDLSEFARKRYALLQTPAFVEEFLLDRTLEPALQDFGLEETTLVDPACGSGHFLLGAFARLFRAWQRREPATHAGELARRALDALAGVDLNPFAVAIARFRLLVAALVACGIERLAQAPKLEIHVAAGDSLLHGPRPGDTLGHQRYLDALDELGHTYVVEDPAQLRRLLGRKYAVVVANPPYITPKDKALNEAYRRMFGACHMKYSLAVPFKERCFDLVRWQEKGETGPAGYVALITANSFMKREFGKKLIEEYVPRWDLTHVLDTSGAYIPGHGTPTVILIARGRKPVASTVRAVRGIRGEPSTPDDPAQGQVWRSILTQVDRPGSQGAFTSADDVERATFHKHPWSLGGGGAAELKERLEEACERRLGNVAGAIGIVAISAADEVMIVDGGALRRHQVEDRVLQPMVVGDEIRDWQLSRGDWALFPYESDELLPLDQIPAAHRWLWPCRTVLGNRATFSKLTYFEEGRPWWEWHQVTFSRFRPEKTIAFAEVASHNHFVLDRGGKVFKQTAPVIKLPPDATEDNHLALLGLLNSSTACFWMKQVCHQKQLTGGDGVRVESISKVPYQFGGTALGRLPIPAGFTKDTDAWQRLCDLAREADSLSREFGSLGPSEALRGALGQSAFSLRQRWDSQLARRDEIRSRLVLVQEEIDFVVYCMFGLGAGDLQAQPDLVVPGVDAGMRAFEIAAGKSEEGYEVPPGVPGSWPVAARELWNRRIAAIRANPDLALIEAAHYKRRWIGRQGLFNHARNTDEFQDACGAWLLDRLEHPALWTPDAPQARSCAQLADALHADCDFQQVAEVYRGRPDFDLTALVTELVLSDAVPAQKAERYKPSGLRKREEWEKTWDLQRQEDAIDARTQLPPGDPQRLSEEQARAEKQRQVGTIPVPPKYASADFKQGTYWSLRGKLDVPKERFVLLPGAERAGDPSPVVLWAGYDHLQQAQAIAAAYVERKTQGGWEKDQLLPLLVALHELVPWVKQWHNAFDPTYSLGLGDYFQGFVEEEARGLGLTPQDLDAWQPRPKRARRAGRSPSAEKAPKADKPATKRAGGKKGTSEPRDKDSEA